MNNNRIMVIVELADVKRNNHSFWKLSFKQVNTKYDKTAEALLNQLNFSLFHDPKLNRSTKMLINAMVVPYIEYLKHPKTLPSKKRTEISWLDLKGFLTKALQQIEINPSEVIKMEDK